GVDFLADISRIAGMTGLSVTSFFDVGAWCGEVSAAALTAFPQARVTAFEPNPAHCEALSRLRSKERFSFHQIALGHSNGTTNFFFNAPTRESTIFRDDGAKVISVPRLTLDSFCERQSVNRVDVLKIDAEGADMQVLHGAEKTLATRGVHFVYCE